MTVRITQIDDEKKNRTILQIEGKLHGEDAEVLEEVFDDLQTRGSRKIDLDLAGLSFINSDSAAVLKRIEGKGAVLTGLDFFIEKVIESNAIKNK